MRSPCEGHRPRLVGRTASATRPLVPRVRVRLRVRVRVRVRVRGLGLEGWGEGEGEGEPGTL